MPIDLKTAIWGSQFHRTIDRSDGSKCDMYLLHGGDDIVSIAVPHGRQDIVDFIRRCANAGQKLYAQLPVGVKFAPDEAPMDLKKITKGLQREKFKRR